MPPLIKSLTPIKRRYLPSDLPRILIALLACAKRICTSDYDSLEKLFLCYYHVIDRSLAVQWERISVCEKYSRIFIGAVLCTNFIQLSNQRRYRYISTWNCALEVFYKNGNFKEPALDINMKLNTFELTSMESTFSKIQLGETAIAALTTWPAENQNKRITYLSLTAMHMAYGGEFTNFFYNICKMHLSNSRSIRIPALGELSEFMLLHRLTFMHADFKNPEKSKKFWSSFKIWYFKTGYERNVKLRVLSDIWKGFCNFANKMLFNTDLICTPRGGINKECPTFMNLDEVNTKEVAGQIYNYKPTRSISNNIPDSEAIETIFKTLRHDIYSIKLWGLGHARQLMRRLRELKAFNSSPTQEILNCDRKDRAAEAFKKEAFAAHQKYGHITENEIRIAGKLPRPLSESAKVLAAPTAVSLIPLIYYLIATHPQLTPKFICSLEIYDENKNIVGLIYADHCTYLRGFKFRRGAHNAEQKIKLSKASLRIIRLIIQMTAPAREYLKNRGDQNWKKLFITTGKGFGYPRPMPTLSLDRERLKHISLPQNPAATHEGPNFQVRPLNISAKSIRATSAIIEFIKHKNLGAIANALGHKEVSVRLLRRYIPKPLIDFFNRRWIQIFHQAIIIEAMEGSQFLLQATDFPTHEDIAIFLETHYVKFAHDADEQILLSKKPELHNPDKEVLVIINQVILILLLRLSEDSTPKKTDSGLCTFWKQMSQAVVEKIDSPDFFRPDIKLMLDHARERFVSGEY